jgi:hypothetical protein
MDEGLAYGRDLYLATHSSYKRQTAMTMAGFEPAIPVIKRPQKHASVRAAAGISSMLFIKN